MSLKTGIEGKLISTFVLYIHFWKIQTICNNLKKNLIKKYAYDRIKNEIIKEAIWKL